MTGTLPAYHFEGKDGAPVLVLSHCLGTNRNFWQSQVDAFNGHFRILHYDHRGHGGSGSPAPPWEIKHFGRDLLRLLDHLQLSQVHFCGLSLGGMVGMWLGIHAPGRVGKLVLANTTAFTENPALLQSRLENIRQHGLAFVADDVLDGWLSRSFQATHPDTVAWIKAMLLETPAETYLDAAQAVCRSDLRAGLAQIQSPSLVITGSGDKPTPPAWGELIASKIPGSHLVQLDSCHLSNIEAASEFNDVVLGFLLG